MNNLFFFLKISTVRILVDYLWHTVNHPVLYQKIKNKQQKSSNFEVKLIHVIFKTNCIYKYDFNNLHF